MKAGVLLREREFRRAPLRLGNIGKPWAADCDNLCHQAPVVELGPKDRPEISGLSSWFSWWSVRSSRCPVWLQGLDGTRRGGFTR